MADAAKVGSIDAIREFREALGTSSRTPGTP